MIENFRVNDMFRYDISDYSKELVREEIYFIFHINNVERLIKVMLS